MTSSLLRTPRLPSRRASVPSNARSAAVIAAGATLMAGSGGVVFSLLASSSANAAPSDLIVSNLLDNSGPGSLRHAIEYSNANGGGTITVQSGLTGTINLASNLPYISEPITITGPGHASLIVDGGDTFKMFETGTDAITISGLSLTNAGGGQAAILAGHFTSTPTFENVHAPVVLNDVVISGGTGSGIQSNNYGNGSYLSSSLTDCVITGNAGSGVQTNDFNWTVSGSTFSYNGQAGFATAYAGSLTIDDSTFAHNNNRGINLFAVRGSQISNVESYSNVGDFGAGLRIDGGAAGVIITDSSFHDNDSSSDGGGVHSNANLTMTRVVIADNSASGSGGGVQNTRFGTLHLVDSTISGNTATTRGGGVDVAGYLQSFNTKLYLDGSLVTDNSAYLGGGIGILDATASVTYSDISLNIATQGGAISATAQSILDVDHSLLAMNDGTLGGSLWMDSSTATVDNTTITGGASTSYSVARLLSASSLTVIESTIADNTDSANSPTEAISGVGATTSFTSSILWGNTRSSTDEVGDSTPSSIPTITDSIFDHQAAFNDGGGNITDDPLLDALADNGGLTDTMAIAPGSPALDAGSATSTSSYDQRGTGYDRKVGSSLDIGAFETQPAPPPTTSTTTSTSTTTTPVSTTSPAPTTIDPGDGGALPSTGSDTRSLLLVGTTLTVAGGLLGALALRRRA